MHTLLIPTCEDHPRGPGLPPAAAARIAPAAPGSMGAADVLARGIEHHNSGRLQAAIADYQRVYTAQPDNFDAIHLMGVAAYGMRHFSLAEKLIRAALRLRPDAPEALNNLGNVLHDTDRPEEALHTYLRALELKPDYVDAFCNLGNVLLGTGNSSDARACFEQARALAPHCVQAMNGMLRVSLRQYDLPAAERWADAALTVDPTHPEVLGNAALSRIDRGLPEQALTILDRLPPTNEALNLRAIASARLLPHPLERDRLYHGGLIDQAEALARADLERSDTVDHHNFLLKCFLASPRRSARDYYAEARAWAQRHTHEQALPQPSSFRNVRAPQRRLRVGIVGDYFDSMIGMYTLYPWFREYDRERIDLVCYNFGSGEHALRELVSEYRGVRGFSDGRFFEQVRSDRIDIMLDINGRLRTPNFFDALLRMPAPIQVNWYNLPATVGSRAYNYLIADECCVPEVDTSLYVEKVFRMPDGMIAGWDMGAPPQVAGPPLERNGYPTFGCFADFFKVNHAVVQVWAQLLHRVKNARLYLKSNSFAPPEERARVAAEFKQLGIAGERLILEGPSPYPIMKRLYELVDVALDTFPYSSGSTTVNALWQGVPVVTMRGEAWRGRTTSAILAGAGLQRWITGDIDSYLALAERLAGDVDLLRRERATLGEHVSGTPQWQPRDFAILFEGRLRAIWQDWLVTSE